MNRYFNRRQMLAGLLAAAAGTAAIASAGLASAGPALHGLHGHSATADPAAIDAHFDELFMKILPDGTPRQRAQLKVIAMSVHTDLGTLHAQFRTGHQRAHVLLLQSTVDPTSTVGSSRLATASATRMNVTYDEDWDIAAIPDSGGQRQLAAGADVRPLGSTNRQV